MSDEKRKNLSTFAGAGSKRLWSTNRQVSSALGSGSYRYRKRETLVEQLANAKDADEIRKISVESKTNQGYADVINYYKSMYHYRYVVTPVSNLQKSKRKSASVLDANKEMLDVVETINFEAILPHLLETGLYEGRVTVYIEKHGDGLVTHVLPNSHSEPFLKSSYGTETVIFDLEYFDDLLNSLTSNKDSGVLNENQKTKKQRADKEKAELIIAILGYFPKELMTAYLEYAQLNPNGTRTNKPKGPQLITLAPESAAIIPFSPSSAPPKINVAGAEENYKEVVEVQSKKNKAGLEKIFTHKIPIGEDGDLLLTVDEARDIQVAMEQFLGKDADVTVITTIGDTNLYDVQKEQSERNRAVSEAYEAQYDAASINPQLFRANTDYALGVSLNRDAAFMWDILKKIMNFYNIVVNEVFNFGDYTCEISLLPITVYNEKDRITEYRRNAEYGIGKLEAIVATGQKQISLLDRLILEQELNLDGLLTPLQSSHTRSSKDQGTEATVKVEKGTESKDEDSKEDPKEKAEEVKDEEKD